MAYDRLKALRSMSDAARAVYRRRRQREADSVYRAKVSRRPRIEDYIYATAHPSRPSIDHASGKRIIEEMERDFFARYGEPHGEATDAKSDG